MDTLRRPFFILAVVLLAIAVLVELGSTSVLKGVSADANAIHAQAAKDPELADALTQMNGQLQQISDRDTPPGLGVPYLAFLDGVLLFSISLIAASLIVPERVQGRVQGCASLIFMIVLLLAVIAAIISAFVMLMIMVALLLAVPFGTLAYLAIYGFFDRGGAAAALSIIMLLKLGFAGSLLAAHQRFLENTGLVLLIVTSLVGSIVVSLLQGLVPGFLVSITDAIAAIIVGILACVWGVLLLIGAIGAVLKAVRLQV